MVDEHLLTALARVLDVGYEELPAIAVALGRGARILSDPKSLAMFERHGLPSYVNALPACALVVPNVDSRTRFVELLGKVDRFDATASDSFTALSRDHQPTAAWYDQAEALLDDLADEIFSPDEKRPARRFGSIALDVLRAVVEGLSTVAAETAMRQYGLGPGVR